MRRIASLGLRSAALSALVALSLQMSAGSASFAAPSDGAASGSWRATGSLKTARFSHNATLLKDGRVLVTGGCVKEGTTAPVGCLEATASAEVYDPASGGWKQVRPMRKSRVGHTAVLLPNGKVLVAGGCVGGGIVENTCPTQTNSAELFDPAKGRWTATGDMKAPRTDLKGVLLPSGPAGKCGANCGKVFVVGSRPPPPAHFADPAAAASLLTLISETYDPATGVWRPAGQLPQDQGLTFANPGLTLDRCSTATGLSDGSVLVVGGSTWVYGPADDKWRPTAKPEPIPRSCHSAARLKDGRVLLAGGRTQTGTGISDPSVEFYDPAAAAGRAGEQTGTPWKPGPPLALGRLGHVSAVLPNGSVLVMAGAIEALTGPAPRAAELFDPALKQWRPAGEMVEGRGGFPAFVLRDARPALTATVLKDGRVLAVGGAHPAVEGLGRQGEAILASSEIYTPAGLRTPTQPPAQSSKGGIPFRLLGLAAAVLAVLGLGWAVFRRMNGSRHQ